MLNYKLKEYSIFKAIGIMIAYLLLTSFVLACCLVVTKSTPLSYLISYSLMIFFFVYIYKDDFKCSFLKLKEDLKKNILKVFIVCTILTILIYVANGLIYYFFQIVAPNELETEKYLSASPILMGINVIVLGPIIEELVYRYPFKFVKGKKIITYVIASTLFALTHLSNLANPINFIFIIPYLLLSFSLGYGLYKTDNILVSILIHIMNNLFNIVLLLVL